MTGNVELLNQETHSRSSNSNGNTAREKVGHLDQYAFNDGKCPGAKPRVLFYNWPFLQKHLENCNVCNFLIYSVVFVPPPAFFGETFIWTFYNSVRKKWSRSSIISKRKAQQLLDSEVLLSPGSATMFFFPIVLLVAVSIHVIHCMYYVSIIQKYTEYHYTDLSLTSSLFIQHPPQCPPHPPSSSCCPTCSSRTVLCLLDSWGVRWIVLQENNTTDDKIKRC